MELETQPGRGYPESVAGLPGVVTGVVEGDLTEGHTARVVDRSLADLRLHAVKMGGLVIDQVASAVKALLERDPRLAQVVTAREALVNEYDEWLDRESLTFIALQHPFAGDLRVVRGLARAGLELERCGDEANKIARFATRLSGLGGQDPVVAVARSLRRMADLCVLMLREATRAIDEFDAGLARGVLRRDEELDQEFASALRLVMSFALQDRALLRATIDTIFALKGLERIGDHAKNIAEQVLYIVDGAARAR